MEKTIRDSEATRVLRHEICHQLTHELLPVVPWWVSEGMAEYVAMIPNQKGSFLLRAVTPQFAAADHGYSAVDNTTIEAVLRRSVLHQEEVLAAQHSRLREIQTSLATKIGRAHV